MSLKVKPRPSIPEETVKVAQAAFAKGNRYMVMRAKLGTLLAEADFVERYATRGQPGISAWRLALIQIFADMEDRSDERAADAVRSRIDWKYALSLERSDKGFAAAVQSDFRCRLVEGGAEALLFAKMLGQLDEAGYLKKRGRQRTDATHVLSAARTVNRLVLVGETMRHAQNVRATRAPEWLQPQIAQGWLERYEKRFDDYHLPKAKADRKALADQIGEDGPHLLKARFAPETPKWLHDLPALRIWHRVWVEQYVAVADEDAMCWREASALPPSGQRIHPPDDPHARYAQKRTTEWTGYKVHLRESCDDDQLHVVTNVLTTQTHDKLDNPIINIRFAPADCLDCPLRARCTRSATQPRHLSLRPKQQFEALQQRRLEQQTPAFQKDYSHRAAVEGTISQAVRATPIRRSRFFGFAKPTLHNFLAAAALNLYRITDYLAQRPRSFTRSSPFVRLALYSI